MKKYKVTYYYNVYSNGSKEKRVGNIEVTASDEKKAYEIVEEKDHYDQLPEIFEGNAECDNCEFVIEKVEEL